MIDDDPPFTFVVGINKGSSVFGEGKGTRVEKKFVSRRIARDLSTTSHSASMIDSLTLIMEEKGEE